MGKVHPLYGQLMDAWNELDDSGKRSLVVQALQLSAEQDRFQAKDTIPCPPPDSDEMVA